MPVNVRDLKPGDRVMLNCPKARYKALDGEAELRRRASAHASRSCARRPEAR